MIPILCGYYPDYSSNFKEVFATKKFIWKKNLTYVFLWNDRFNYILYLGNYMTVPLILHPGIDGSNKSFRTNPSCYYIIFLLLASRMDTVWLQIIAAALSIPRFAYDELFTELLMSVEMQFLNVYINLLRISNRIKYARHMAAYFIRCIYDFSSLTSKIKKHIDCFSFINK